MVSDLGGYPETGHSCGLLERSELRIDSTAGIG